MAPSANTRPHFTTIAQFIRELGPAVQKLFVDVLMYCDELGLIGKEMFAIEQHVAKHRKMDESGALEQVPGLLARNARQKLDDGQG